MLHKFTTVFFLILASLITIAQMPELSWAKALGGFDLNYDKLHTDKLGNIYFTGTFTDSCSIDYSAADSTMSGEFCSYFSKIDNEGTIEWINSYCTTNPHDVVIRGVVTDTANNVYISGYANGDVDFKPGDPAFTFTTTAVYQSVFVAKYNAAGEILWMKHMEADSSFSVMDMAVNSKNELVIAGLILGSADFDPSAGSYILSSTVPIQDQFLAKYSKEGDLIWAHILESKRALSAIYDIVIDHRDNILITGLLWDRDSVDFDLKAGEYYLGSNLGTDMFLAKYDENANLQWAFNLGGNDSVEFVFGHALEVDSKDNVYCAGYLLGNEMDFDPSGAEYLLTAPVDYWDAYLTKYSAEGAFKWVKEWGGPFLDVASGLAISYKGDVYVSGEFSETADFDPGAGEFILATPGWLDYDNYITKYDSLGNFEWAEQYTDPYESLSGIKFPDIHCDLWGNLIVTGNFNDSVDVDLSAGETTFYEDFFLSGNFIAKYGKADAFPADTTIIVDTTTQISHASVHSSFSIYPNPSSGVLNISVSGRHYDGVIEIYDTYGNIVSRQYLYVEQNTGLVNVSDLPSGTYVIRISDKNGTAGTGYFVKL